GRRRLARLEHQGRRRRAVVGARGVRSQGPSRSVSGRGPARGGGGRGGEGRGPVRLGPVPRGVAPVRRGQGGVLRRLGRFDEAKRRLRTSLEHFERVGEKAEQALAQWEIARLGRDSKQPRPLVTRDYLSALDLAESSRREHLVLGIDEELKGVNPEA